MNTEKASSDKQIYQDKVQAQLDKFNAQIDEWNAKARQAQADARIEYQSHLDMLLTQQQALQKKLEELKSTSEDAWEEFKMGVDLAWRDLQAGFEVALSKFEKM